MTNSGEMLNAIFYLLRTGCSWRHLPHDFPPWKTVYTQFRTWRSEVFFERINRLLNMRLRKLLGRNDTPSAGIVDSQSVKKTDRGGEKGYDGAKKIKGRKRHILVDTEGLLIDAHVSRADFMDRDGLTKILEQVSGKFKWIKKIWADMGYQGKDYKKKISKFSRELEIVKRPPTHFWISDEVEDVNSYLSQRDIDISGGFKVLPKRWIVERTLAWFGKYRRLSKDYEYKCNNSKTMLFIAMIRNTLKRISKMKN